MFHVPEEHRLTDGPMRSSPVDGNNGVFIVPYRSGVYKVNLGCIASDGAGWEHVSVSRPDKKIPDWHIMCFIKDLFWDGEDAVMQLHPPKSRYVNNHPGVLHLWRPMGVEIPQPPIIMV